jgi:hypothetical protein
MATKVSSSNFAVGVEDMKPGLRCRSWSVCPEASQMQEDSADVHEKEQQIVLEVVAMLARI